jgi:hypothetical protein
VLYTDGNYPSYCCREERCFVGAQPICVLREVSEEQCILLLALSSSEIEVRLRVRLFAYRGVA